MTVAVAVHIQDMTDELANDRPTHCWLQFLEQPDGPPVTHLAATKAFRNLRFEFQIKGALQFLLVHGLHAHLGVVQRIAVIIGTHPFPEVLDQNCVEGRRQQAVLLFKQRQR